MKIRTRIAPSPTGDPHVGTPYMALFNLIFAKHNNGEFILRIEDTDRDRSEPEYEKSIFDALKWLNIDWDEGPDKGGPYGPYRQSQRTEIYRKHCMNLLKKGHAYKCFATQKELKEMRELSAKSGKRIGYDRRYRNLTSHEIQEREAANQPYVIRLKVPLSGECHYEDMIKGKISCPWSDIDDQILLKSDGYPTYHLASVVDDYLMKITHVIRGDEWMSSTPKHVLLYDLFGWDRPKFMHMPLLLGQDGKKLSKRKNPTSVSYYRKSGYIPAAFVNFLTHMGYSMPNDNELYDLSDIIKEFSLEHVGKSGAFFDVKKLDWINQQYLIQNIPEDNLWPILKEWGFSDEKMSLIMPLVHTRIKTFGEFMELCQYFFINHIPLTKEILTPKNIEEELAKNILQCMIWDLEKKDTWDSKAFETATHKMANFFQVNHKKIVMGVLFGALTGKHHGPPLFLSIDILGKDLVRARMLTGIEFLGSISNKKSDALKKNWDIWLKEHT